MVAYPDSSRLFVWESRRLLSQEASFADSSRHYGFYIDGDIAKLPGGGRRGAAVLCELMPGKGRVQNTKKSVTFVKPRLGGGGRGQMSNFLKDIFKNA